MKYKPFYSIVLLASLQIFSCSKSNPIPSELNITLEDVSLEASIHTMAQSDLINSDNPATYISDLIDQFGNESNSKPSPVLFRWSEENNLNQKSDKYILSISENSDLSNPLTFSISGTNTDVYNLKINTMYYYQLTSIHSGKKFYSDIKQFTINDKAPRNIYVDGVENVRDLGGWNIGEGRTLKQGMIYRTAQFNYGVDSNTYVSKPSKQGKSTLLNELKIKSEIDLRRTQDFAGNDEVCGITSSPLGKSVNYISTPMYYSNRNIFTTPENASSIRAFFDALADVNNYPVAFHCMRGTDRTGALAYAIGALVGMSEEDLMLDYLFSDLAKIGTPVTASTILADNFYVQGIRNSEGTTLSEKTKNYLNTTCGVLSTTLDTIIDILPD